MLGLAWNKFHTGLQRMPTWSWRGRKIRADAYSWELTDEWAARVKAGPFAIPELG